MTTSLPPASRGLLERRIERGRRRAKKLGEHQSRKQARLGVNAIRSTWLAQECPGAEHRTKPKNNRDKRETHNGIKLGTVHRVSGRVASMQQILSSQRCHDPDRAQFRAPTPTHSPQLSFGPAPIASVFGASRRRHRAAQKESRMAGRRETHWRTTGLSQKTKC